MRLVFLLTAMGCLLAGQTRAGADEILTPAEAAKSVDNGRAVTVEFVVKSCHPVLPGTHFRLVSEPSFKDKGAFIITLKVKAATSEQADELSRQFLGKRIRVAGKVEKAMFHSIPETRPGIAIDDLAGVQVIQGRTESSAEPSAAADRGRMFAFWDSWLPERPRLLSWGVRRRRTSGGTAPERVAGGVVHRVCVRGRSRYRCCPPIVHQRSSSLTLGLLVGVPGPDPPPRCGCTVAKCPGWLV